MPRHHRPLVSDSDIIAALDGTGITTAELARRFRSSTKLMSTKLSRLASWGKIGRELVIERANNASGVGVTLKYCLWHALEPSLFAASALDRPRSRSPEPASPPGQFRYELGTSQAAGAGCDPPSAPLPSTARSELGAGNPAGSRRRNHSTVAPSPPDAPRDGARSRPVGLRSRRSVSSHEPVA